MTSLMDNKQINARRIMLFVLLFCVVIASICKVFIGIDCDEMYIVALGARLLQGDHMMKEMWELHQTSALPVTFFMWIWKSITGSYTGVFVFLRVITGLIQAAVGFIAYKILKPYYKNADLVAIFLIAMLPRTTQNLEYGLLSVLSFMVSLLILFWISKQNFEKKWMFYSSHILAAFFFSLAVLSYPTMIIVVLFILPYFIKYDKKGILIFGITCIVLAGLFTIYILMNVSPDELMGNIFNGILADGSHQNKGVLAVIQRFIPKKDKMMQGILVLAGSAICYFISKYIFKTKTRFVYWICLVSSLILIGLNITGIRPSGPLGFQIRYLLIILFGLQLFIWTCDKDETNEIFWLFYFVGVGIFVASVIGSNLTCVENATFAIPCLVAIILAQEKELVDSGKNQLYGKWISFSAICVLIFSSIFIKGYFVRISGTSPANIFEKREQMTEGPLKYISVYPDEKEQMLACEMDMKNNLKNSDTPLVLTSDGIWYINCEQHFSTANCISTPRYDKQWVTYYRDREYVNPTILVIDKKKIDVDEFFEEKEFGQYLRNHIDEETAVETENMYFIRFK